MLMKTQRVVRTLMLFLLMAGWTIVHAQESREEVPGDHFSLEGALELFKKSASPEEFEQLLNSPKSEVNNLDLNGDGDIDYIRVIDRNEGNVHAFILQAVISDNESQDVAVIELEKLSNGKAVLQITGDADVYGIETIIEPTEEVRVNAGTSTSRVYVNVWSWPSVQYVYSPYYYGWSSPWSWSYRPIWWNPWRPIAYSYYYPRWQSYRPYYSVCYTHRVHYAQQLYRPYRNTSVIVYNRHHEQISNYRSSRQYSDINRGRDNDRQRGSSYSYHDRDHNQSRSTTNSLIPSGDNNNRGRSASTRSDTYSNRNRSATQEGRTTTGWNRNSSSEQRRSSENRSGLVNPGTSQRDRSSFDNRSATDQNRWQNSSGNQRQNPDRSQHFGNTNGDSRQRESSSTYESRGAQRSAVQTGRSESSGHSGGAQRSGSNGSSNKSGGQKRGRD
jgi:hypothetical protein